MDEYYEQINKLIPEILIPARTQKTINTESFQKFYDILEKIEKEIRGKENIQRKIAGLLFFTYCSLSDQLVTNDYRNEMFRAIGRLEDILDKIFWDSPFKGEM